eukprot:COSAG01_NODE_3306_length_6291_cov_15.294574_6_plen_94_part_00
MMRTAWGAQISGWPLTASSGLTASVAAWNACISFLFIRPAHIEEPENYGHVGGSQSGRILPVSMSARYIGESQSVDITVSLMFDRRACGGPYR